MFESESMWPLVAVPSPMLVSSHHSSGFTDSLPGVFWPSPLRPSQPLHTLRGRGCSYFSLGQRRKPKIKEAGKRAQIHVASEWQSWESYTVFYCLTIKLIWRPLLSTCCLSEGRRGRMKTGACLSRLSGGL